MAACPDGFYFDCMKDYEDGRWQKRALHGPFSDEGSIAEAAAFLLRRIAQDPPFADGNQRTGFAAAEAFLHVNGSCIGSKVGTGWPASPAAGESKNGRIRFRPQRT